MTNEDAINILLYMKHDVIANSSEDVALDMAIEALKPKKPKTNADRIRQMTDEEIADIVRFWLECDYCPINDGECQGNCYLAAMEWLKQEVQENDD